MEGEKTKRAPLRWRELEAEFNDRQMAGHDCDLLVRLMLARWQAAPHLVIDEIERSGYA